MISVKFIKNYCEAVYGAKAIYVLGANSELLTKELYEKLVGLFGKNALKDIVIERDEGKLAGDCSGFIYPLSKSDKTADGYYKSCAVKGKIADMPLHKTLFVFRENKKGIMEHMGIYTGDNTTFEMNNGCEKKPLDKKKWTHYGIPEWILQEPETEPETTEYYPNYAGETGSIVEALLAVGEKDISFAHRKEIAAANGIRNYSGTAAQNIKLLKLLAAGQLIKI